jgi:iron-sulfur cluster repair protein YtfE (RIC family)
MELATDILRREHREMERLLEHFESELGNPQGEGLAALARTFAEIQGHLASHFRKEEEVFYPALAPLLVATDMEISKLLDAHADIRETASALQELLNRPQAATTAARRGGPGSVGGQPNSGRAPRRERSTGGQPGGRPASAPPPPDYC